MLRAKFSWIEWEQEFTSQNLRKTRNQWMTTLPILRDLQWKTCQYHRDFTWNCWNCVNFPWTLIHCVNFGLCMLRKSGRSSTTQACLIDYPTMIYYFETALRDKHYSSSFTERLFFSIEHVRILSFFAGLEIVKDRV